MGGSSALGQSIWYVDAAASGAQSGTTWADAFVNPQQALVAAFAGDQMWVAAGTYTPDYSVPGDRAALFFIPSGVSMYGGFLGNAHGGGGEDALDHRDPSSNLSILSGDLNGDDDGPDFGNNAENSRALVLADSSHRRSDRRPRDHRRE
jgi:hypothetical protein